MPKFLSPLDLTKNELKNPAMHKLASAPGTPVEAQMYYNTVTKDLWFHNGTAFQKLSVLGTGSITTNEILDGTILNADISPSAAIGYSKLALTGSIVNADVAAGAAIVYSKLNLTASIVLGDLAASLKPSGTAATTDEAVRALGFGANNALSGTTRLDQIAAPTASVSLNSQKITNLLDPTGPQDAATKAYADSIAVGLTNYKQAARLTTTAALPTNTYSAGPKTLTATANGALSVDGIAVAVSNRILVKNEAAGQNNGLYTVTATGGAGAPYVLTRALDADTSAEVTSGMFVFTSEGSTLADTQWVLSTDDPITLATTPLVFTQFASLAQLLAGAGLTKTGNTVDVVAAPGSGIVVNADNIDIDPVSGLPVNRGGTGAITAAGAKASLGFMTRFATSVGDGSATSIAVTHSLGTKDVAVVVRDNSDDSIVETDIVATSTSVVTLSFAVAPTSNQYRVVVIG